MVDCSKRVEYLKELNKKEEDGVFDQLPKKEAALLRREHDKLRHNLGGLTEMTQVPDIAIVVDPKRESTAIAECKKLGITIISILDTNCDPNVVDIPIPANDDAVRSIHLIISTLADAIQLETSFITQIVNLNPLRNFNLSKFKWICLFTFINCGYHSA